MAKKSSIDSRKIKQKHIFNKLTLNARTAIISAVKFAKDSNSDAVTPDHLFIAVISNSKFLSAQVLSLIGVDIQKTIAKLKNSLQSRGKRKVLKRVFTGVKLSKEFLQIIYKAFSLAKDFSSVYVGTEHLLLALVQSKSNLAQEFASKILSYEKLRKAIFVVANYPLGLILKPNNNGKRASSPLRIFGRDLTRLAKEGKLDPLVGRKEEVDRIINILSRRRKNNPIIVGEAGVGKTALIEGLAQRIATGEVPPSLRESRIVALDIASIVAGSKMRGEMEEKIMAIISEVSSSPNTIVFIDEIHTILSTGFGGGLDIGQIMKPALVSGVFRVIGATTTAEYSQVFEEDVALNRRFVPVFVEEK
jgi:ATP-dependent Clp protease ATP-binding subunit ClpA